ncbi:hypothetical protein [Candidatus Reidiella endopervernicosa]|uniref:Uncharacterized protein n=1 Tax=Candidatus Reidiella endopervernicosa TaxID=2738883 RepID=A0A6N0HSZ9_9GAMM|nr:hypothetical protein [Candidatus Reidiella endopervernicosa]QKQ25515.1 hypothetical protein HUE57_03780 [Candidatus Reidiella endopervernicosa]
MSSDDEDEANAANAQGIAGNRATGKTAKLVVAGVAVEHDAEVLRNDFAPLKSVFSKTESECAVRVGVNKG